MLRNLFSNPSKQQQHKHSNKDFCRNCTDKVRVYQFLSDNGQINVHNIKPIFMTLESCKDCRDIGDINTFITTLLTYLNHIVTPVGRILIITNMVVDATDSEVSIPSLPEVYFYLFMKIFLDLDMKINPRTYNDKDLQETIKQFNIAGSKWKLFLTSSKSIDKMNDYTAILTSKVQKV